MQSQRLVSYAIRTAIMVAGVSAAPPSAVAGQEVARTFQACYVPEVGVVYLIDEPGLPSECLSEAHQAFSWTEGPGGAPELTEGSVTSDVLADAAVTAEKLAAGAVQATHIAAGAVGAGHIQAETIGSGQIVDDALTGDDLAAGSVTGSELAPSAVTGEHVQDGTITGDDVADGALTGDHVGDGTLTGDDVAQGALTGDHVADGSLARSDLGPDVLTAAALAYVNGTTATPTLVRNRNVVSVARVAGAAVGSYEITFDGPVNLATAYVTATPLGSGLTVGLALAAPGVLWVFVRNAANEYTDAPFFVIVF